MRSMISLSVSALLLGAASAWGLTPYRVADINPAFASGSSNPDGLTTVGGISLFHAADGVTGRELWRSDGTAAGTYQVMDFCEGVCSGDPAILGVADGRAFVLASEDGDPQGSLWVTNGTRSGTFRLTEGVHVRLSWPPAWVQALRLFFFLADDGVHGTELWRSDGTPAGTFQVADLRPGPESSGPRWLIPFAGKLFFRADDGIRGASLWSSNGTAAGTRLVKDTAPDTPSQPGPLFITTGKRLFFFVYSLTGDLTLWKSDGTPRGTVPVTWWAVSTKPPQIPDILDVSVLGNRLLFVLDAGKSGEELWASDGTAAGTKALTRFSKAKAFVSPLNGGWLYLPFVPLGSRLVFAADDGPHGQEMWVTDGTAAGTRLLRDTCPGTCSGGGGPWPYLFGGRQLYAANDGVHGLELWATDGTPAGTVQVHDICPGICSGNPFGLITQGGRLLFIATDLSSGTQVWRTDGTAAGTVRVSDFAQRDGIAHFGESAVPAGALFTFADPVTGVELWRTDGTAAGTALVRDINEASDGTAAGTRKADVPPHPPR